MLRFISLNIGEPQCHVLLWFLSPQAVTALIVGIYLQCAWGGGWRRVMKAAFATLWSHKWRWRVNYIIITSTSSLFWIKRVGGISHIRGVYITNLPLKTEHTRMSGGREEEETSCVEGMKAHLLQYPQAWVGKHNIPSSGRYWKNSREVCHWLSALYRVHRSAGQHYLGNRANSASKPI